MSAGLVSSPRRNAAGQLVLIQTSAAISGGSSGGGLFNDAGQLIGLTTIGSVSGDAQNLNFAVPSDWVRELPQRHASAAASAAVSGNKDASAAAAAPLKRGDRIVYRVTDLLTGVAREAVYTVDRLEAENVVFTIRAVASKAKTARSSAWPGRWPARWTTACRPTAGPDGA